MSVQGNPINTSSGMKILCNLVWVLPVTIVRVRVLKIGSVQQDSFVNFLLSERVIRHTRIEDDDFTSASVSDESGSIQITPIKLDNRRRKCTILRFFVQVMNRSGRMLNDQIYYKVFA